MNWKAKKEISFEKLLSKMCKYCGYQDRCIYEVEQKINEYFIIPQDKDRILDYLIDERFLDENRFVEQYVKSKFRSKRWGKIKISQHLKQKNIASHLIEKALNEYINLEEYTAVIAQLGKKKWESLPDDEPLERKAKTMRYLASKGFESESIYSFLAQY